MDPITLIVTALAAGAALGVKDTASTMVTDGYAALKALVKKRLGGGPDAELMLAKHEKTPEAWHGALTAELTQAGADGDRELIAAAQRFLDLTGKTQASSGKFTVDARGAQAFQIGDKNRQKNILKAPPAG